MSRELCWEAQRFQSTLVRHCAPALAGIKPADLISWGGSVGAADAAGPILAEAGVALEQLGRRGDRQLLLIYRRDRLAAQLLRPEVQAQLRRDGYPVDRGPAAMVDWLKQALRQPGEFPHEVGLFLGYPAADVEGFRLHRGLDYLYSGLWKVYADVEGAKRTFAQYRRCQLELSRKLSTGGALAQLLPHATGGC